MQYRIETSDGYKFHYKADDESCVNLINGDGDFSFSNEAELLQWVAENIDGVSLFECLGTDPIITQFMNSGDHI